jgi:peptide/nickel transport system permease protein
MIRHALRNALIPLVTFIGILAPITVGGTIIIEIVFNLPGMGHLIIESIKERDYPLISGVMIFFGFFVMMINLIVDLTCAYLDPRVRL